MNIATRMRKVRELKGWKQSAVAASMQITQQALSYLEQGTGSPRIDTLTRFCDVMNVQLHFLLAEDLPVTEETVRKYGTKSFSELIRDHCRLESNMEILDRFLPTRENAYSHLTQAVA